MIRIVSVVGGRPQYIKVAAVTRALEAFPSVRQSVIDTGQHHDYEMSGSFLDELRIPHPQHCLDVHGGTHGEMTGRMLIKLDPILIAMDPDLVVVYGDTNSTLAGALSASKIGLRVAHVEAGLRSFRRSMPEEINRVLTDHCSDVLFCPTNRSLMNLQQEGVRGETHLVGDVMYDVALTAAKEAEARSTILQSLGLVEKEFCVLTIHRSESTADPSLLRQMLDYVKRSAGMTTVFPLHPRTRQTVTRYGIDLSDFVLTDPLPYTDMTLLVRSAATVFTDSGGLQKEAYFHRVPCVTLRDETEWVETVECGWNRLWSDPHYRTRIPIKDYGDGNASGVIAAILAGGHCDLITERG